MAIPFIDDMNWSTGLTAEGAPILIRRPCPVGEGQHHVPLHGGRHQLAVADL